MFSKLVLSVLWLGFVAMWIRVMRQVTVAAVISSLELLLMIALAYALLLGGWINHNIAIFKAKGARTGVRELGVFLTHDYLGVPVSIQVGLQSEQEIVVDFVNGHKCYRASQAIPGDDLEALISHVGEAPGAMTASRTGRLDE
jgi:hypothetical protein